MADKRIADFATLEEAQDDDLLLVSSEGETYNMKFGTFKEAVQGDADRKPLKLLNPRRRTPKRRRRRQQPTHRRRRSPLTPRRNPPHALSRRFWTRRRPSHPSMNSPKISTT